jgi:Na+/H+ antiporter NhaC
MSALVITFLFIYFDVEIGSMKKVKFVASTYQNEQKKESKYYMILPILSMIGFVFFYLYMTGDGDMMQGSGSSSVFYTMLTTLALMFIYYISTKNMNTITFIKTSFLGAKSLFSVVVILLLAFAIGKVTSELQTGIYLASLASSSLEAIFVAPLIFLLSSIIAFSTGTSWGTFSIMIPIAIPIALGVDTDVALAIGAVISGGVFGDHISPISDTTIISSIATDCEVISHVKTQIPYALVSASVTFVLFIIFSMK